MNKLEIFFRYFIEYENYKIVLIGLRNTLVIAICGLLIGIVVGSVVAAFKVAGTRSRVAKAVSYVGDAYTGIFRGTPIIVQLIVFHYVILRGSGINPGAYVAESLRGGIQSVDAGQEEAARSLGLSGLQSMRYIIIPQAIKNVIPAIGNELIALLKETSIVSMVGLVDLTYAAQIIGSGNKMATYLAPMVVAAAFYLAVVYLLIFAIRVIG